MNNFMSELKNRRPKFGIKPERIIFEFPIKYLTIQCEKNNRIADRRVVYWTPIDEFKKTKHGQHLRPLFQILEPALEKYIKVVGGSKYIQKVKKYEDVEKVSSKILSNSKNSVNCRILYDPVETILVFIADLKKSKQYIMDYKTFYEKKFNRKYNWNVKL